MSKRAPALSHGLVLCLLPQLVAMVRTPLEHELAPAPFSLEGVVGASLSSKAGDISDLESDIAAITSRFWPSRSLKRAFGARQQTASAHAQEHVCDAPVIHVSLDNVLLHARGVAAAGSLHSMTADCVYALSHLATERMDALLALVLIQDDARHRAASRMQKLEHHRWGGAMASCSKLSNMKAQWCSITSKVEKRKHLQLAIEVKKVLRCISAFVNALSGAHFMRVLKAPEKQRNVNILRAVDRIARLQSEAGEHALVLGRWYPKVLEAGCDVEKPRYCIALLDRDS